MNQNRLSWAVFFAFVAAALSLSWHSRMLEFDGASGIGKAMVWLAFVLFTGYSVYCSTKENIFKTIARMAQLHWGRQIGLDLYLGLILFCTVVYLQSGWLVLVLWLLPILLFANLATLLYVAIHFDALVARFVA
jgi:hypothetical protein